MSQRQAILVKALASQMFLINTIAGRDMFTVTKICNGPASTVRSDLAQDGSRLHPVILINSQVQGRRIQTEITNAPQEEASMAADRSNVILGHNRSAKRGATWIGAVW